MHIPHLVAANPRLLRVWLKPEPALLGVVSLAGLSVVFQSVVFKSGPAFDANICPYSGNAARPLIYFGRRRRRRRRRHLRRVW